MIKLRTLAKEDIEVIKNWPVYPDDVKELDFYLRDGGWPDRYYGKPGVELFVAICDSEIIGFGSLEKISDDKAYFGIFLRADKIGKGLGRQISDLALEKAFCEYGYSKVSLGVRKHNFRALKLYKNMGFRETREEVLTIQGIKVSCFMMEIDKKTFSQWN